MGSEGKMREIKFRGKREDNKQWVYGSLGIHNAYDLNDGTHKPEPLRMFITEQDLTWVSKPDDKCWRHLFYKVDPATVGQLTGLKDKNGIEVFEGDILNVDKCYSGTFTPVVVEFVEGGFEGRLRHDHCLRLVPLLPVPVAEPHVDELRAADAARVGRGPRRQHRHVAEVNEQLVIGQLAQLHHLTPV